MIENGCGWGDHQNPPAYYQALDLRRHLSNMGLGFTALAWDVEMVMKDIRVASNDLQRQRAVARINSFMSNLKLPEYIRWTPYDYANCSTNEMTSTAKSTRSLPAPRSLLK